MNSEGNLKLMKTLDDAWNNQDWDTFNKRHADEVAVYWPAQPEPTRDDQIINQNLLSFLRLFQTIILTMIHIRYYLVKVSGLVL